MSRNLVRPYFGIPPSSYDQAYFSELVRSFSVFLQQIQNPGEGRNTTLVLTNLPTDDFGLETGALFQQAGFVKVSLINTPHVRGVSGASGVGAVGVITT